MPEASPPADPDFGPLRVHLARLRNDRGWTLDELAGRSGVDRSTLHMIETGKPRRNPKAAASNGTLTTWWRLAEAFNLTLGEMLAPLQPERTRGADAEHGEAP